MPTPSLKEVVNVATISLRTPPEVDFDERASLPLGCEGEEAIRHYKATTKAYATTWQALQPIVDQVRVLHPGVFRERDDRGLPIFIPFSVNGDGIASITIRNWLTYPLFSADFASVEAFYEDVPDTMRKIAKEQYRSEPEHQKQEKLYDSLEAQLQTGLPQIKSYPVSIAMAVAVVMATVGLCLDSWLYHLGAGLFTAAAVVLGVIFGIARRREFYRFNRMRDLERIIKTRQSLGCNIFCQFTGTIPPKNRQLIRVYQDEGSFDDIFLLTECDCQVEYVVKEEEDLPKPVRPPSRTHIDPLVIGTRKGDDRFFLISQFDLLPSEQRVTDEAKFLSSGIDWDALLA